MIDFSNTKVFSIASWAFFGCTSLTTLKLSPTMFVSENSASIGKGAFGDCTALTKIYLPEVVSASVGTNCKSDAFDNCPETGTFIIQVLRQI
ncbi:MAG: leucine-rich repeat domain-containing protein [Mycoplasmataceae bacterium]|nr:leucine-rich repeat domain-containing protein [Mycoplasmataceae bacterium]